MLTDPDIRAVFPPWGGETAVDLLDLLDWEALAAVEPTWVIGFSDTTTWMLPLTLRLDWATVHGAMLMDEPYRQPDGLARWSDLASATGPVVQRDIRAHRTAAFEDWVGDPGLAEFRLDGTGEWSTLGPGPVDVTGRLVGGCIETVTNLAGTPYGDLPGWADRQEEGTIVYLEACERRRVHDLPQPARPPAGRLVRPRPGGGDRQHAGAGPRHADPARGGRRRARARSASRWCSTSGSAMSRRGCRWSTGRWPGWSSTATGTRSPRT